MRMNDDDDDNNNALLFSFLLVIGAIKFEEIQRLVFRVYDVDTFTPGFDNNNTSKLDLSKQVSLILRLA